MVKLAIVAAILPAAAGWWTTEFAQAAISEPDPYALYHCGDLPSASCLAESPDKERVIAEFVEATAPNTVPSPSLIPGSQRYRVSALSAWQR